MAWSIKISPLATDGRRTDRNAVIFRTNALMGDDPAHVEIVNLSPTGILFKLMPGVEMPASLIVELPQAGAVRANLIWFNDVFCGCEFERPISRAAVSATLLGSEIIPSGVRENNAG